MGLTDMLVRYDGTAFGSALGTFDYWRDVNGCGTGEPGGARREGQEPLRVPTPRAANGVQVVCAA